MLNASAIAREKNRLARLLEGEARQWSNLKYCPFISADRRRVKVLSLRARARTLKRSAQSLTQSGAHGPKPQIHIGPL